MGDPAIVAFAGDPQPVEIHHRGIWYSGELLGWTNTEDGRVLARVRCVVDGLRHSTWKDLAELRLPDPARPPRREAFPAPPARPLSSGERDEDEATRPHALFAGAGARSAKPAHVSHPPQTGRRPGALPRPAASGRPPAVPQERRRRSDELTRV
ncbi:hypothetical protein A6V29_01760 [Blastococcus sp. CCUG 61487]|nr:hypothetical protein A6V29_01760 [Blastococcus sp. CCUG 61487]